MLNSISSLGETMWPQPRSQGLSSYRLGGKMRDPGNEVVHFPHSALSTLLIFHTPHFPHSVFSTHRIFRTPYFPHTALSTLRTPHSALSALRTFRAPAIRTPHFSHHAFSALRPPHFPPNRSKIVFPLHLSIIE